MCELPRVDPASASTETSGSAPDEAGSVSDEASDAQCAADADVDGYVRDLMPEGAGGRDGAVRRALHDAEAAILLWNIWMVPTNLSQRAAALSC